MSSDPLIFEEINIRQAPGFDREQLLVDEIVDGVNVVHGPNAAGKTTLATAIEWLLWPDISPDRVTVGGRVRRNDDNWEVDVDHGRGGYRQDGADVSGPTRPPAAERDRYRLALHDLLQADTDNGSFANVVQRESAGGYDIVEAADHLGFDETPTSRRSGVYQDAEAAVEAASEAEKEVQELRGEQTQLSSIEADLADAKAAKRRVALLEDAIDYVTAKEEYEAKARTEAEYPEVLAELDGDEAEDVAGLEGRIDSHQQSLKEAEEALDDAEATLEETGLTEQTPTDALIDQCSERLDTLRSLESDRQSLKEDIEGAEAKRERARSQLPLDLDTDELTAIDPDVWKDVATFARLSDEVRAKQHVKTEVEEWLGDQDDVEEQPHLERGAASLERWLSTSSTPADTDNTTTLIAGVGSLFIGTAAVVLGVLAEPIFFGGLLLAAIAGYLAYQTRGGGDSDDPRKAHRETFRQLTLDPPSEWSEDAVRSRLNELYDAMAYQSLAQKRDQFRAGLRPNEADLEQRVATLEQRREELRSELGAAPATTDIELTVSVTEISRWQDAHGDVVELNAELESVGSEIETSKAELEETLSPYGYDEVSDAATGKSYVRDLKRRLDTHRNAVEKRDRAESTIATAAEEIETLEAKRDAIFTDHGLDPDDRDRLEELCDQLTEYEQVCQERREAANHRDRQSDRLEEHEEYEESLKSKSVPALEADLDGARTTAQQYDDLNKKKTEIETRIQQAKQDSEVETALAQKDRSLDALEVQLREDYASMVGDVITEHLRDDAQIANRPEAYDRACHHLITITNGRYDLAFDDDRGTFLAQDTVRDRVIRLDELSDGTRLQLLLAVRLAFVEVQEGDPQLPLMLDETLANSDDERASIIIDAMIDLARDGRQIFYFTAQGDEVARWERALDQADVTHATVDLADKLGLESAIEIPELESIHIGANELPDPSGHDHRSFGEELGVPEFNPRQGAPGIHVWYLVDDLEVLERLLDTGIERWGQLRTVLDRSGTDLVAEDTEVIESFRLGGLAIEAFVEAWQQGRGEPVDRAALEATDAVTDSFIDEVSDLARTHDGNARKIIQSLRNGAVNRFRSDKMDQLEEYFEAEGYIPATNQLDSEQIQRRVLQRLVAEDIERQRAVELARDVLKRVHKPPGSTAEKGYE